MRNIKSMSIAVVCASAFTSLGIVALSAPANAGTLKTSGSFDLTAPDVVNSVIPIQKFDSSLGTLNSVLVEFTGTIRGDARFENRSSRSTPVFVNLAGLFDLTLPTGDNLSVNPEQGYDYQVARYDRVLDFAGASGRTVSGLTSTLSTSQIYSSNTVLNALTGSGFTNFLFSATDNSSIAGSGNFSSSIQSLVEGDVSVTYDYTSASTPIPTPALLPGLVGMGVAAIRKRKAEQKEAVEA